MSGTGQRFIEAGFKQPKPLIEVEGRPIIEHIVNMFPDDCEFVFICNKEHLKTTNIRDVLGRIKPHGKIVSIEPHNYGPVYAVLKAEHLIKDDEEVIINYCDFKWWWDWKDFSNFLKQSKSDGCIAAYRGFHPHSLGSTYYAYMKCAENTNVNSDRSYFRLLEIREKESFTNNRMEEFASSGTYYFRKGVYVKKYFKQAIEKNVNKNGEYYVSLVYNLMNEDNLNTYAYEIKYFLQWGTPQDLMEYIYWSDAFRAKVYKQETFEPITGNRMTVLIPMAGEGQRFAREGYTISKPLIEVSGKAMFFQAINDLPKGNKYIFLCRKEHIDRYQIDKTIKSYFKNSRIIAVDTTTSGQLSTCMLAENHIEPDEPLLIAPCDNGLIWSMNKWIDATTDPRVDAMIWSFRNNVTVERNPKMYGWIRTDDKGNASEVSCKVPVSENPSNDHAVIGAFYFSKGKTFTECAKETFEKKRTINNEYYVDVAMNAIIESGKNVKVFEVDKYLCWGTPNDLRTYQYWQNYFDISEHPYSKKKDEDFE